MCGLGMEDDRLRDHQRLMSRLGRAPAEVDVVAEDGQFGVQPAQFLQHPTAYQHAGGVDREHRTDFVVLTLVVLAGFQSGLPATGSGDGQPYLQQAAQRGPLAKLRAQDLCLRMLCRGRQQLGQRIWRRVAVVVQQPDPFIALDRRRLRQSVLNRGRVMRRARQQVNVFSTQCRLQELPAPVSARGVQRDYAIHDSGLLAQPGEHRR